MEITVKIYREHLGCPNVMDTSTLAPSILKALKKAYPTVEDIDVRVLKNVSGVGAGVTAQDSEGCSVPIMERDSIQAVVDTAVEAWSSDAFERYELAREIYNAADDSGSISPEKIKKITGSVGMHQGDMKALARDLECSDELQAIINEGL